MSCAPAAHFVEYDVHQHYPIFGTQFVKIFPPHDFQLADGESYAYYWGKVKRKYFRKGKTIVEIVKNDYSIYVHIEGKTEIPLKTACYMVRINENNSIVNYLVCSGRKYKVDE